jgi:hypothetical protein
MMPAERTQYHRNNCAGYFESVKNALIAVFYAKSGDIDGSVGVHSVVELQR